MWVRTAEVRVCLYLSPSVVFSCALLVYATRDINLCRTSLLANNTSFPLPFPDKEPTSAKSSIPVSPHSPHVWAMSTHHTAAAAIPDFQRPLATVPSSKHAF